ncbi:zinc finger protein-like [Tropilaelaps mercedesae]|uniref:Zinc finger protein-like n=1 Tax=Tropilaelaps mercedesae TaxID=418985 RepID=A0A1V9X6X4_9ACAR|nr:zinc finger protein-like [Tropilaelaps mercedesae]
MGSSASTPPAIPLLSSNAIAFGETHVPFEIELANRIRRHGWRSTKALPFRIVKGRALFLDKEMMAHPFVGDCRPPSPGSSTSWQDQGQLESKITSSEEALLPDNCDPARGPLTKGLVAVSIESTKCILCLASFKSAEELRAHIRIVHARSERHRRRVVRKENVSTNPDDQHDVKPEKAPTPLTREGAKTKPPRRKRRAPGLTGSHECFECRKRFQQLGHLRNHLRLHTGERPFVCEICGKAFPQSGHLVSHVNSHTNTRPYECQFCKKRFTQSGHLRNHERLHLGIRPYQCAQCEKSFTQSGHLVNHLRLHDGEKPYRCSVCGRRFTQSGHLASHAKMHNSSRGHQCDVCHKGFIRAEHLTEHTRMHSDPRPFTCRYPGCGARLSNNNLLAVHMQLHQPDETATVYKRHCNGRANSRTSAGGTPKNAISYSPASADTKTSPQLQNPEVRQKQQQQRQELADQQVLKFLDNANFGGSNGLSGHPVIIRMDRAEATSAEAVDLDIWRITSLDDIDLGEHSTVIQAEQPDLSGPDAAQLEELRIIPLEDLDLGSWNAEEHGTSVTSPIP